MKSKFLYQDVDIVFLANKGVVVRCFVCSPVTKFSKSTSSFELLIL